MASKLCFKSSTHEAFLEHLRVELDIRSFYTIMDIQVELQDKVESLSVEEYDSADLIVTRFVIYAIESDEISANKCYGKAFWLGHFFLFATC